MIFILEKFFEKANIQLLLLEIYPYDLYQLSWRVS